MIPRIFFYCINGTGIGHLTRSFNIAQSIINLNSKAIIKIVFNGHFHPNYKSSRIIFEHTRWTNIQTHLNKELEEKNKKDIYKKIIKFKPNVIIFDNKILEEVLGLKNIKKVLILRALKERYMKKILKDYYSKLDLFIVPHITNELSFMYSKQFYFNLKKLKKVKILGPIIKREKINRKKPKQILFTIGGGGIHRNKNSKFFFDTINYTYTFIKFLKKYYKKKFLKDYNIKIIVGPNFDKSHYQQIKDLLLKEPELLQKVYFVKFIKNIIKEFSKSYIYTLAGYNTTYELIYNQIPAIYFVKRGITESQKIRSEWIKYNKFGVVINKFNIKNLKNSFLVLKKEEEEITKKLKKANIKPKNDEVAKIILQLIK